MVPRVQYRSGQFNSDMALPKHETVGGLSDADWASLKIVIVRARHRGRRSVLHGGRQQLSCIPDRWEICSRSTIVKLDLFNPARNFAGKLHLHLAALPGALGRSGNKFSWNRWRCKGFAEQTPDFVKGVESGWLKWGFKGKHRKDIAGDISVSDVQWLLKYLGRITDAQIRSGLEASGATPAELECYSKSLRQRIEQLQEAATQLPAQKETTSAIVR